MGRSNFWTDDRLAILRRLMNLEVRYEDIANELGTTRNAVQCKAKRLGWSGPKPGRGVGYKHTIVTRDRIRSSMLEHIKLDPDYRARMRAHSIRTASDRRKRDSLNSLGYVVPASKREEYRFYRKKLGCPEAAAKLIGLEKAA
jgi:hypothetical protein